MTEIQCMLPITLQIHRHRSDLPPMDMVQIWQDGRCLGSLDLRGRERTMAGLVHDLTRLFGDAADAIMPDLVQRLQD